MNEKDELIEKVCEFLERNIDKYIIPKETTGTGGYYSPAYVSDKLYDDLRKEFGNEKG